LKTIGKLESAIGGKRSGVSFFGLNEECKENFLCPQAGRFCETIKLAAGNTVLLDPRQFTCLGARYVFGCRPDPKRKMIKKLAEEKGYSLAYVSKLIEETPHCETQPAAIGINIENEPDVLLAQLQPAQAMRLIRLYQKKLKKVFQIKISGVITVCGNVTVKALQTQDMAISFGCDDSRAFGGLTRNRLYVGVPYGLAVDLIR